MFILKKLWAPLSELFARTFRLLSKIWNVSSWNVLFGLPFKWVCCTKIATCWALRLLVHVLLRVWLTLQRKLDVITYLMEPPEKETTKLDLSWVLTLCSLKLRYFLKPNIWFLTFRLYSLNYDRSSLHGATKNSVNVSRAEMTCLNMPKLTAFPFQ